MGMDPIAASAIRVSGSAVIMLAVGFLPAWRFRSFNKSETPILFQAILAGWMGYGLAMTLLIIALKFQNTGIVAVLGSTAPVIMLPIIWIRTRKSPSLAAWLGACLVVFGTAVIIL